MRIIKMLFALIVSVLAIVALTMLAMRYMDVMMKPYMALRKFKDKVMTSGEVKHHDDPCCCSCEDVSDFED